MNLSVTIQESKISGGKPIDPNDEWTSYSTEYYESSVLKVEEGEGYGTYTVPDDTKHVYVVCVKYSDGCTFTDRRGLMKVVDVFVSVDDANKLVEAIQEEERVNDSDSLRNMWKLVIGDKEYSKFWRGYFSEFEGVQVTRMKIT